MTHVYYVDTSALIKVYIDEDGSGSVQQALASRAPILTATITYAEMYATFFRLYRQSLLSKPSVSRHLKAFEEDWRLLILKEFDATVRAHIPKVLQEVQLKGADLIHLATVLEIAQQGLRPIVMASDQRLLNAAQTFELRVQNPEDGSAG